MEQTFQKGKWLLTHRRYVDEMGFERDSFDLFDAEQRIHRPFHGMIKASNVDRNFPINKVPFAYTEKDYEEMLDEQVKKLSLTE